MKKVLAIAALLGALSGAAFADPLSPGLWDFSTLDIYLPSVLSTGFLGDVGLGLGANYEANLGRGLLARVGAGFYMPFSNGLMGVFGEGGLSLVLDSAHGRLKWSAVGEDALYTYSYTGTTGADLLYALDLRARVAAAWGDYGSSTLTAAALVGPRYLAVYNTGIAPFEAVQLYAYGVVGYAAAGLYYYYGSPDIVGGHLYFGAIAGARWWMFGLELGFADGQFQFRFDTMLPFSWMPGAAD